MLETVKNYLKITWDDEDSNILEMIERGKADINDLVGAELTYSMAIPDYDEYKIELENIIEMVKHEEEPITTEEAINLILTAEEERDEAVIMPNPAFALLLDYCRYAYNNAIEYFEENFQREILRLQLKTGVAELPEDDVDEN